MLITSRFRGDNLPVLAQNKVVIKSGSLKLSACSVQCLLQPEKLKLQKQTCQHSLMLYAGAVSVTGTAAGASAPGSAESAVCLDLGPFAPPCSHDAGVVGVAAEIAPSSGCAAVKGWYSRWRGL